ncbi:putative C6 transcription factor [Aspergillus ochraceoroseus]|uniref:Putative C6 transcription factor n=1 Tax=Aspergillus ochraceoroseus TaxID=138278 RepID=A0A0F8XP66_9EURO|nr:putative C6 transcription factor [Aspergillus ochraceoroseus]
MALLQYPPASYPPPAGEHQYPPPPSQYQSQSNMAAIHPHVQGPQDAYRLPPPPGAYRPPDVYAQAPPPPPQVVYQAAAPRQRTAIACRYCRRRKIRCSGFESSQDGRCSNCIRFNQECMFTPVSSQAQAFVPAHAAYPHLRNPQNQARAGAQGVMLYGAHGQPLPPQQQPQPGPETTLPPPQGMYQHSYGNAPPPLPSVPQDHRSTGRRGSGSGFEYPDPTNLAPVTPATSAGYQSHTAPYYPPPPHDRRPSPQSAYPYDSRHSSSPHGSPYPPIHHRQGAITPPPTSIPGASARSGLNVRDMLNPGDNQGRSSTDSDMLNALNRRGLNQ